MTDDHRPRRPARAGECSFTDAELREVHTLRESGLAWNDVAVRLDLSERTVKDRYGRAARNGVLAAALGMAAPIVPMATPRSVEAATSTAVARADFASHTQAAHTVRIRPRRTPGWEQYVLLTSDHHWDHPDCDRELLGYHLDLAAERSAGVIVAGDLYCAMQGRMDRRGGKGSVRPEHQTDHYFDALVETGVEWYRPWAPHLWLISDGNHESAVHKYLETDLTGRLCQGLARHGSPVMRGDYAGFVTLLCDDGQGVQPIRVLWDHGSGGGGPVTKGVIGTNRRAARIDADIVVTGHVHERWIVRLMREGVDDHGVPYARPQDHVCCAGYKRETGIGSGWNVETGKGAKPLGGWWLRLYWSQRAQAVRWTFTTVEE